METPKSLGKYELQGVLGQGAMGVVYKGFDPNIARFVAIKTIRTNLLDTSLGTEMLERFRNEAKAVGRLNHPNIVSIYEFDQDHGIPYFVMEFVEGHDLKTLLRNGTSYSPQEAVHIIDAILSALSYTHKYGIVHRDIKPANVFITADGSVKLADFGIARLDSAEITQMGNVMGTPSYMSPEQCQGKSVDARSDLFACGVLLYELLVGERAFTGDNSHAVLHNVVNQELAKPSERKPELGKRFDGLLKKALAKSLSARFQTATEFSSALEQCAKPSQMSTQWLPLLVVAVLVLVIAAGAGVWIKQQSRANQEAVGGRLTAQELQAREEKIGRLLSTARVHYDVGRLVSPQGSNAFDAYQIILQLDPSNQPALDGIAQVKDRFFKRATVLLMDGQLQAVNDHIAIAEQLFPNDIRLPALKAKLTETTPRP